VLLCAQTFGLLLLFVALACAQCAPGWRNLLYDEFGAYDADKRNTGSDEKRLFDDDLQTDFQCMGGCSLTIDITFQQLVEFGSFHTYDSEGMANIAFDFLPQSSSTPVWVRAAFFTTSRDSRTMEWWRAFATPPRTSRIRFSMGGFNAPFNAAFDEWFLCGRTVPAQTTPRPALFTTPFPSPFPTTRTPFPTPFATTRTPFPAPSLTPPPPPSVSTSVSSLAESSSLGISPQTTESPDPTGSNSTAAPESASDDVDASSGFENNNTMAKKGFPLDLAIIGGIAAGAACCLLLTCAFVVLLVRGRRKKSEAAEPAVALTAINGIYTLAPSLTTSSSSRKDINYEILSPNPVGVAKVRALSSAPEFDPEQGRYASKLTDLE
jgi:hypothetical protein